MGGWHRKNRKGPEHYVLYAKWANGILRAAKYGSKVALSLEEFKEWMAEHSQDVCSCGAPANSLDHVVPLSRGGQHSTRNFQMLCRSCNSRKCAWLAGETRTYPWTKP
jgi:hypothetical protein